MTIRHKPLKVRLAIQGGGAKLVDLLAAMEAIQELENENVIEITGVIGTSAGAIAGAILAAGIEIDRVKDSLQGNNGRGLLSHYKISTPKLLYKLLRGKPAWDDKTLREWLVGVFNHKKIETIGDLIKLRGISFTAVSTDLNNRSPFFKYQDDKNLIDILLDSCGLPYLFRVWGKNNSNTTIVDGGLCENLPSSLIDDEDESTTVAISFKKSKPANPTSLFTFSGALLDVAIESSMEKARKGLKGYLYEIDTQLATFGFDEALDSGLGDHYLLKKKETKEWFRVLATSEKGSLSVLRNPWSETNETASFMMNAVSKIYRNHHANTKYILHQMVCVVEANCLVDEGNPFYGNPARLMYELKIQALPDQPIYCIY